MNSLQKGPCRPLSLAYLTALAVLVWPLTWSAYADVLDGMVWLSTQSEMDGSIGGRPGSLATRFQSTAEAVRTYQIVSPHPPSAYGSALLYVNAAAELNTEFLSHRIQINASTGAETVAMVERLVARQNVDGGFGDYTGYASSTFDTAYALEALSAVRLKEGSAALRAVAYLLGQQLSGGGYAQEDANGGSDGSTLLTAIVSGSLAPYRVTDARVAAALDAAHKFLLARRDGMALWGETFVSAVTLTALVRGLPDPSVLDASIVRLEAAQLENGSWKGDVYTTALALRALWLAAHRPPASGTGAIEGRALDALTRMPLASASVAIQGPATRSIVTAGDGRFRFQDLPVGDYAVAVTLEDYQTKTTSVRIASAQTVDMGDVALLKNADADTGTLRGTIKDAVTGQALSAVSIGIVGGPSTFTDSGGHYQISNVAPGRITMAATRVGYGTASGSGDLVAGGTLIFSPLLTPASSSGTVVQGRVTAAADGQPLAGVTVRINGAVGATTDESGNYRITDVAPGTLTLTAELTGYDTVTATAEVPQGAVALFSPKLYLKDTTPPDGNAAGIKGVVLDAASGTALVGVTVQATFGATTRTLTADAEGRFSLTGLVAVGGTLVFSHPGYLNENISLTLAPLTLVDLGEVRMRKVPVFSDLVVGSTNTTQMTQSPQTLEIGGALKVTVVNQGVAETAVRPEILVFYDVDRNGSFDAADLILGKALAAATLGGNGTATIDVPLEGQLPFRDAPLSVFVDSAQAVAESREDNNTAAATPCGVPVITVEGITAPAGYNVEVFAADVTNQQGPIQLAFDGAGTMFVATGSGATVLKIPAGTRRPEPFGSTSGDPDGIVVDSHGNVIVADSIVRKFDPTGVQLWEASCPADNTQLAAIDAADNVYVGTASGIICKIGPDGHNLATFSGVGVASEPVIGPDGFLYVGELSVPSLDKRDADTGALVEAVARLGANSPAFGPDGNIYVGSVTTIQKVSLPGKTVSTFAAGFSTARAVAFDRRGHMFVGDSDTKKIFEIYPRGGPVDLTAGRFVVAGAVEARTLTVRVGNAGAETAPETVTHFYEGRPDAGGRLLGKVPTPSLAPGGFGEISLTGVANVVGTIDLYAVVDAEGAVSECREDNNHVSIAGPRAHPDLVVDAVDITAVQTDPQTLGATGSLAAVVRNQGTFGAPPTVQLVAFYDVDGNHAYDGGTDVTLGSASLTSAVPIGGRETVAMTVQGTAPFRDAPISVWVDSAQQVAELDERNNVGAGNRCSTSEPAHVVLTFEDFTVAECPPHSPFSSTRYLSEGVVFTSEGGSVPFCWNGSGSPSVLDHPHGGAYSYPFGVIGNGSGTTGVRATFVDPVTGTSRTTRFVRAAVVAGPGTDQLSPNVALIGYDAAGNEVGRHHADTTSRRYDVLEIRAPGIAQVLMTAGPNKDAYDNLTFDGPPAASSDLTASLLRVEGKGTQPGVRLSLRVGNASLARPAIGGGNSVSSLAAEVAFYDGDPSAGGNLLGRTRTAAILAGGYQDLVFDSTVTPSGTRDIQAVVDSDFRIAECREDNNAVSTRGPKVRPDLIVSAVNVAEVQADPQTFVVTGHLSATVHNQGLFSSPPSLQVLAFYDRNADGAYQPGSDVALGTGAVSVEIPVGGDEVVSWAINGPSAFRDEPIAVWVDSTEDVTERDESNNVGTSATACGPKPATNAFRPVLKWAWTGSATMPSHRQVMSIPIVVPLEDTNGDGRINGEDTPGVVFHTFAGANYNFNGVLRAISGKDGRELWTAVDYRTNGVGSLAAADIDGDGMVEIVAPQDAGGLIAVEHDGTLKWRTPGHLVNAQWGGASIADIDGDGTPEIVVGATVLNADGTLRWRGTNNSGGPYANPLSIVADIDLDGRQEIIAGGAAYSPSGQLLWSNQTAGDGFAAVANLDADPYPEITVVSYGRLSVVDHLGATVWSLPTIAGGGIGGPPTIADLDGDGRPEIGVAGATAYGVYKADGTVLWTRPTQDASSHVTGSSVFDFDGDGQPEIVYNDERFLRIYRGRDGVVLFEVQNSSGTAYELPVVADVDADGHADVIVATNDFHISGNGSGIRAYTDADDTWVPTRRIWNQHSYHITNIEDDGRVPRVEAPSWRTHNTYRLNAFSDRSATSSPDLTVSRLVLLDHRAAQGVRLTARAGNAGGAAATNVEVAFYDGDPSADGTALGTITVGSIAAGRFEDVVLTTTTVPSGVRDLYVVVDSLRRIAECREDNNVARVALAPSVLARITVSTDAPLYGPDAQVRLRGSVVNLGAFRANLTAELAVEDAGGVLVQAFPPHAIPELAGGARVSVKNDWNTAAILVGRYHVRGVLRDPGGNVVSESVSAFDIQSCSAPDISMLVTPVSIPGSNPDNLTPVLRFALGDTGELAPLASIPPSPETLVVDPIYAAFGPRGELFIANRHGNAHAPASVARFKFEGDGRLVANGAITGNGLEAVHGLALSSSGELFAGDLHTGLISRFTFDKDGRTVPNGTFPSGNAHAQGLAFAPDGELFVTDSGGADVSRVQRWRFDPQTGAPAPSGTLQLPGAIGPHGLAFGPTGELFIADVGADRIYRFLFDGAGDAYANGTVNTPAPIGVAFSAAGDMFVTAHGIGGIRRFQFDEDGNARLADVTATPSLGGLAIGRVLRGPDQVCVPSPSTHVVTDRPVYGAWATVRIDGRVRNTAPNVLLGPTTVEVTVRAPSGAVAFTKTQAVGELGPLALRDLAFSMPLVDAVSGTYPVTLVLTDTPNSTRLSSSVTSFVVRRDDTQALAGTVTVARLEVHQGEPNRCLETTRNVSAWAVSDVRLVHELVDLERNVVVDQTAENATLGAGTAREFIRDVDTARLTAGDYSCVLRGERGGETRVLAFAGFRVLPVPVRVDAELGVGARDRLLVLVDPYDCGHSQRQSQDRSTACDADPHGPRDAPGLRSQRAFLETALQGAGWSYKLVDTAAAFTREMRSGAYRNYALFTEQEKLSSQAQRELREAVYRGEGLLVAGSHDPRHHELLDALGIKLIGTVRHASEARIEASTWARDGVTALIRGDQALRLKRVTAARLATYLLSGPDRDPDDRDDCCDQGRREADKERGRGLADKSSAPQSEHDECDGGAERYLDAATLNSYGRGRAVFVGFDLLAAATRDGAGALLGDWLMAAVQHVNPEDVRYVPSDVLPVAVTVANRGTATPIRSTLVLPEGAKVVDVRSGRAETGAVVWQDDFPAGQTRVFLAWLRLPPRTGSVSFRARIEALQGTGYRLLAEPTLTIPVEPAPRGQDVVVILDALIAAGGRDRRAFEEARRHVRRAIPDESKRPDRALDEALQAVEELRSTSSGNVSNVRMQLARWIRMLSGRMK